MRRYVPRRRVNLSLSMVPAVAGHFLGPRARRASIVRELELALSGRFNGMPVLAVDSGRKAMVLILQAVTLQPGSRVLVPDYTLDSLALLIRDLGLQPVPVDVCTRDFNIDPGLFEKAVLEHEPAVLVAPHMFGMPFDIRTIIDACKRHNIFLIEDCAHALGTNYDGRQVGTFGDAAILSFSSIKAVHGLGGGAALFKDPELAEKAQELILENVKGYEVGRIAGATLVEELAFNPRLFGLLAGPLLSRPGFADALRNLYRSGKSGHGTGNKRKKTVPRRISGIQAALCLAGLKELGKGKNMRRKLSRIYRSGLQGIVHLQDIRQGSDPFPFAQVVRLDRPAREITGKLYKQGIDAGKGLEIMQSCSKALGMPPLPNTKKLLETCLELPMSSRMRDSDARRVVDALTSILE
ncbi:MAG: aminotransferase class I/II-fold pyridoxal phosphate-dependent enzyme [Deltaproteobacteria bacterium]|nr:aminotransferase class I/II-fold pyridoxal phosphate-dependent enzyme [Deltaproteobacteria bacterium]